MYALKVTIRASGKQVHWGQFFIIWGQTGVLEAREYPQCPVAPFVRHPHNTHRILMVVIMDNNNDTGAAPQAPASATITGSSDGNRRPEGCEETWRTLFKLLPVGVSILDEQGCIKAINPALEQILGMRHADILAGGYTKRRYVRTNGDPFNPADFPTSRAIREKATIRREVIGVVSEDESTTWVEVSAAPLPFADAACVAVTVDITERMQSQEAAEASLRFAEAVADNVPCMLGYWTGDLRCAFANRAYITWFGRTPEQMQGILMTELLGPELFAMNEPYIRAVLQGQDQHFERMLTKTSGEKCFVWAQYVADRVDGAVIGFFVIITDITDFKRQQALEASERQYRRLAEDMPLFIATGNPDGTLTYVNQVLATAFGMTQTEMTGVNFYTLLTPEDREMVRAKLDALTPESPFEVHEETHPGPDGSLTFLRWTNRGFFDANRKMVGFQSVGQDITERKQTERLLLELNRNLENRVAERTQELDRTCMELLHRNRQIRSLAADLVQTEDRERRRIARLLHDHNQQLLVAAKLMIARIQYKMQDSGLQEEAAQVQEILDQCIEASRELTMELAPPIFRDAGFAAGIQWLARWMMDKHELAVTVCCEAPLPPISEETSLMLFQTVRELLFNIVKHAGVREAAVTLKPMPDGIRITVADQGRGFEVARALDMPHSFGLINIQERLALLDGRLTFDSSPGRGARIELYAPLYGLSSLRDDHGPSNKAWPIPSQRHPAGDHTRIRLLVVDDHAVLRQGMVEMLRREPDLEVVGEAVDGLDALNKCRDLSPDLVLMDVSMPRMNGLEATRCIHEEMPGVCIIALSMHARFEMAEQMLAAGAKAYLVKDCPVEDILAEIRRVG